jgi:hypothetical protein
MDEEAEQIAFIRSLVNDIEVLEKLQRSYQEEAEFIAEVEKARDEVIEALQDDSPHAMAVAKRLFLNFFGSLANL